MKQPNLIFIVLDTVRAHNLSCYGYEKQTTTRLEEFCSDAVFFEQAFSPAIWTVPSHASFFTGTYPSVHGALNLHRHLDDKLMTLAEAMTSSGYDNVSFSNNFFISVKDFGLSRGFEISEGRNYPRGRLNKAIMKGRQWLGNSLDCGAFATNDFVRKFIQKRKKTDRPFFLFLNYMEAHAPYEHFSKKLLKEFISKEKLHAVANVNQDRQKFLTRSIKMSEQDFLILRAIYDSQISYLDKKIHSLFQLLKQNNAYDNSTIVLLSDHGDMIGEHDLMHHSYCIYDELIKVPLIMKLPGKEFAGTRINEIVSLVDLPLTIIELVGVNNERFKAQQQGTPIPFQGNSQHRDYIYAECERPKNEFEETYPDFDFSVYDKSFLTIRSKKHKYIYASDRKEELFDISKDPGEKENFVMKEAELGSQLKQELFNWYDSLDKSKLETDDVVVDQEVEDQLKALGYF
jgi:arylsulfatase A-like enzyme